MVIQAKDRGKTMGMAKIPTRMSWANVTWHRKKKKNNKESKNKDNKMVDSLIAQNKK